MNSFRKVFLFHIFPFDMERSSNKMAIHVSRNTFAVYGVVPHMQSVSRNTFAVYGVVPHMQSISRNTFAVYWSCTTQAVYFS